MKSDLISDARCPYCVVGHEFRPMQLLDGLFVCPCGHTANPRLREFRCSCDNCARAAQQIALLAETPVSAVNPRQAEILHSLNLLALEEAMPDPETNNAELSTPAAEVKKREIDIKRQLVALYEQQKAFAHPTPSEQPAEYEPEELESWAILQARIDTLEDELAKMPPQAAQ